MGFHVLHELPFEVKLCSYGIIVFYQPGYVNFILKLITTLLGSSTKISYFLLTQALANLKTSSRTQS